MKKIRSTKKNQESPLTKKNVIIFGDTIRRNKDQEMRKMRTEIILEKGDTSDKDDKKRRMVSRSRGEGKWKERGRERENNAK